VREIRLAPALPVPANGPKPPSSHPKLGKPTSTWTYRDGAGALLGFVLRFDTPNGKEFRPLTCWRPEKRPLTWRWESWAPKRPLNGLPGLAQRPSAPVVICEGERASDAAARLLRGFVTITSPNGARSAAKADWSPLKGRRVVIWPDADAAGLEYAHTTAKRVLAAGATSVAIASPPVGIAVGWDAADAVAAGWSTERAAQLIENAKPFDGGAPAREGDKEDRKPRRTPQRDVLVRLIDSVELWHDVDGIGFASYSVNGHCEHRRLQSSQFKRFVSGRYYESTGAAIGKQALEDGIRLLEMRATCEGPECVPYIRVGRLGGVIYVDLCDQAWRAVEITGKGWRVIENPPVKFWRPSGAMRPLPEPEAGEGINTLRGFVNASDADFMMMVAWCTMALRGVGPFPILMVSGEQGSGKSIM
jgi:putative DNA primase/helicase